MRRIERLHARVLPRTPEKWDIITPITDHRKTTQMSTPLSDFPKMHCPFIRQTFKVDKDNFKQHGAKLQLRTPEVYLVVNRVNPGFEWVFEDPETIAVEKLDGTNVKILVQDGRLVAVQNRLNIIDPLQILHGKTFLMEGIYAAIDKGFLSVTAGC